MWFRGTLKTGKYSHKKEVGLGYQLSFFISKIFHSAYRRALTVSDGWDGTLSKNSKYLKTKRAYLPRGLSLTLNERQVTPCNEVAKSKKLTYWICLGSYTT